MPQGTIVVETSRRRQPAQKAHVLDALRHALWQKSSSAMGYEAMGPGGCRPVPSVLLGVAAQKAACARRVPDRRGPPCPRPAGGEWRSLPPVLQRLAQAAAARGGRFDDTVRVERAKYRKGNGAHHNQKAVGERT
jgi:hypothetical protein